MSNTFTFVQYSTIKSQSKRFSSRQPISEGNNVYSLPANFSAWMTKGRTNKKIKKSLAMEVWLIANILWPSDDKWRRRFVTTLHHAIAQCLWGSKPLLEPMLTYCHLRPWEYTIKLSQKIIIMIHGNVQIFFVQALIYETIEHPITYLPWQQVPLLLTWITLNSSMDR